MRKVGKAAVVRGAVANKAKIPKVMGEFKRGTLHSGSSTGPKVTKPAQAKAIAMSEAGMSKPGKKARNARLAKVAL